MLIVLGIMSVALAVSFAMLRTQAGVQSIAANALRKERARQVAQTGLQHALRLMQTEDWGGVDSTVSRTITSHESFTIHYATGDEALRPTDTDYEEYPFRVTISVTGATRDPGNPAVIASHEMKVVVQLVRREFAASADLSTLASQTITQLTNTSAYVEPPVRVEGPCRFEGTLRLSTVYPGIDSTRDRLLAGLEQMRIEDKGDHRPFNGPVSLIADRNSDAIPLLRDQLNLGVNALPSTTSGSIGASPPALYTLYPGGRSYDVQNLTWDYGVSISNRTLEPDPLVNPLGFYRTSLSLTLGDNVTFRGMLVTSGYQPDLLVMGDNVSLKQVTLPPVESATSSRQLPLAVVNDDFRLYSGVQNCSIEGLLTAYDDFEFQRGSADTSAVITGNVVCTRLELFGRNEWGHLSVPWVFTESAYNADVADGYTATFPEWLHAKYGLDYQPKLIIKPPAVTPHYHWQDFSEPVYKPRAGDDGLRWSVVRIQNIP